MPGHASNKVTRGVVDTARPPLHFFLMKQIMTAFALATVLALIPTVNAADAPKDFKVSEFTFAVPSGWDWVANTSLMRKALLRFPSGQTNQAEVIFFHFGPENGGGVQANIDRWIGMFQEPKDKLKAKTEEKTVNGRKIHYVQAQGTFMSGMPGRPKTPQPGTMLLGAIIESSEGAVFIRCTGPIETVKAGEKTLRAMVEGAAK
jgi:hypothetical protein